MSVYQRAILCLLFYSLTLEQIAAGDDCNIVLIDGTFFTYSVSGLYQEYHTRCSNRPVFQHINGESYLYYLDDYAHNFAGWMVGPDICINKGHIGVWTDADHPTKVTGNWREFYNNTKLDIHEWRYSAKLTVSCGSLQYQGCSNISVSGTGKRKDVEGTYSVLPNEDMCYGKFSYRRSKYQVLFSYKGNWMVGPSICQSPHYMVVRDGALYPYDTAGEWQEFTSATGLVDSPDTELSCADDEWQEFTLAAGLDSNDTELPWTDDASLIRMTPMVVVMVTTLLWAAI